MGALKSISITDEELLRRLEFPPGVQIVAVLPPFRKGVRTIVVDGDLPHYWPVPHDVQPTSLDISEDDSHG